MADEAWTPLARDLTDEVADSGLRVEVIGTPDARERVVQDRVAVQRAAFPNSTFTRERGLTAPLDRITVHRTRADPTCDD